MSYPAASVGFAGQFMLWVGAAGSALGWASHKLAGAFSGDAFVGFQQPGTGANSMGQNAFWLGVSGIAIIVGDRVVTILKNRGERDGKIAQSEDRIRAEVAEAMREKDIEMAMLKADLQASRHNRHEEAKVWNRQLLIITDELAEEKIHRARLEGQLGVTDATHATAINANSENVKAVADATGTELPAPVPHIEPILGSTDEFPAIQPQV